MLSVLKARAASVAMRLLAFLGALLLLAHGALAKEPSLHIVSEAAAGQFGAREYVVHSERVGRDFLIEVTPPAAAPAPGVKLPAVYALDAGYDIAGPVARVLGRSGAMAPAYVIAVGYPGGNGASRDIDLLHRPFERDGKVLGGGGGAAFEAFMLEELRPFIEARYPVDPDQAVLFGHSLAGVFAVNVLADRPEAFRSYLIASPSLSADPQALPRAAQAAARGGGRRVYLAYGGAEPARTAEGVQRLRQALGASAGGFAVETRVFEGAGHLSYYPLLVPTALPWLLPPPDPAKPPR